VKVLNFLTKSISTIVKKPLAKLQLDVKIIIGVLANFKSLDVFSLLTCQNFGWY
jgi:hypothetical protein